MRMRAADRQRSRLAALGLSLGLLAGAPDVLAGQATAGTPQVTATILPSARSIRPGVPLPVAIRISIAPGWHIYWTNPGESGLPTTVQWEAPRGFRAGTTGWPHPERKEVGGVVVHAYEGEVVLLGELLPPADLPTGRRAEIAARLRWGVCREVCIPQEVRVSARLPIADSPPRPASHWAGIAAAARTRIPHTFAGWTLRTGRDKGGVILRVTPPEEGRFPRGPLTFFPDDAEGRAAELSTAPEREGNTLVIRLSDPDPAPGRPVPLRLRGVLVASSGWDGAGRFKAMWVDLPIQQERSGDR